MYQYYCCVGSHHEYVLSNNNNNNNNNKNTDCVCRFTYRQWHCWARVVFDRVFGNVRCNSTHGVNSFSLPLPLGKKKRSVRPWQGQARHGSVHGHGASLSLCGAVRRAEPRPAHRWRWGPQASAEEERAVLVAYGRRPVAARTDLLGGPLSDETCQQWSLAFHCVWYGALLLPRPFSLFLKL